MAKYSTSNAGEVIEDLLKHDDYLRGKQFKGEVAIEYTRKFIKEDIYDGIRSIISEFDALRKEVNDLERFDKPRKLSLVQARKMADFAAMLKEAHRYWNGIDVNRIRGFFGFIQMYEKPTATKEIDEDNLSFVQTMLQKCVIRGIEEATDIASVAIAVEQLRYDISGDLFNMDAKMGYLNQILNAEYLKVLQDQHIGEGATDLYLTVNGEKGKLVDFVSGKDEKGNPTNTYNLRLEFSAEDVRTVSVLNIEEFKPLTEKSVE